MARFTVRGLIVFVGFFALGCAALLKPAEVWVIILLGLTAALLVAGPVVALGSSAARRQFWIGFAVVGWSYFLLVRLLAGYPFQSDLQVVATTVDYFLPTNRLLVSLADSFIDKPDPSQSQMGGGFFQVGGGGKGGGGMGGMGFGGGSPPAATAGPAFPVIGPRGSFLLAGHLLWTLLFAYIGGAALRYSYVRNAASGGKHLPDVPA